MEHIVVSYDISDDAKRNKIAEVLKDYGWRVQYSVFECQLEQKELKAFVQEIKPLVDSRVDKLRIYRICQACSKRTIRLGKRGNKSETGFLVI